VASFLKWNRKMRLSSFGYVVCFLLFCGGCATPIQELFPVRGQSPSRTVYVVSHGWHTGLVVLRDDVPSDVWPEIADFPHSRYLEIGWGDEGFYRAEKITAPLCLKAALLPTPSVMHVVGFDLPLEEYFPTSSIIQVELTEAGFDELCQHIADGHVRDDWGQAEWLGRGIYGNSRFYRANGSYYFPKTCNVWTARGLRKAGCPIVPGIAVNAGNVISQTRDFGHVLRDVK